LRRVTPAPSPCGAKRLAGGPDTQFRWIVESGFLPSRAGALRGMTGQGKPQKDGEREHKRSPCVGLPLSLDHDQEKLVTAINQVVEHFRTHFSSTPEGVWEAPGRVNLMGEHTDYNHGLVLPIALPQRTYAAVRRRDDSLVRLMSVGMPPAQAIPITDIAPGSPKGWERYPAGVIWAFANHGYADQVTGIDAVFTSEVPVGAGLSSSAAIEGAMAVALSDLWDLGLTKDDQGRATLANLAQSAENIIAQAPTGGMDQAACLRSREGHALYLDCADQSIRHIPFRLDDTGLALLVIDTRATHAHSTGEYGHRRSDCQEACAILGIDTLREISVDDLDGVLKRLPNDRLRRRVRHIVSETHRVRLSAQAMEAGDFVELGKLFVDSHASMRDDYEISCPELDVAVIASLECGALGARMTGGGFGGSAIALVYRQSLREMMEWIGSAFDQKGFATPDFLVAEAGRKAGRVAY